MHSISFEGVTDFCLLRKHSNILKVFYVCSNSPYIHYTYGLEFYFNPKTLYYKKLFLHNLTIHLTLHRTQLVFTILLLNSFTLAANAHRSCIVETHIKCNALCIILGRNPKRGQRADFFSQTCILQSNLKQTI